MPPERNTFVPPVAVDDPSGKRSNPHDMERIRTHEPQNRAVPSFIQGKRVNRSPCSHDPSGMLDYAALPDKESPNANEGLSTRNRRADPWPLDQTAYFRVHSLAVASYLAKSVLYTWAISGTSGSSGLGSQSMEQMERSTGRESAGAGAAAGLAWTHLWRWSTLDSTGPAGCLDRCFRWS